jgi:hypothetical protein
MFTNRWYKIYGIIETGKYNVSDLREQLKLSYNIPDEFKVEVIQFLNNSYIKIEGDDISIICSRLIENTSDELIGVHHNVIVEYAEIIEAEISMALSKEINKKIMDDLINNLKHQSES